MLTDKHGCEIKVGDRVLLEQPVVELRVSANGADIVRVSDHNLWQLAAAVEVVAPDDDEPITAERLLAEGWREDEKGWLSVPPRDGIRIGWDSNEGVTLDEIDEDEELVCWRQLPRIKSMGQLRRLVAALKGE